MDTNTEKIESPLVSILMLTYNRAEYLPEAISSVLKQTYDNWELIIIDDGSTDNSAELIGSFKDPRIIYIRHEQNAGLFVRRNESLALPKGKYVAVLDSDDYWSDPDKLAKQVVFLEKESDHVLVGTYTELIDQAGNSIGKDKFATDDLSIRKNLLLRNQFTHSAVMMRQSAISKTRGYQDILAEDLELFLQIGRHGKLANLPIFATAHRIHKNSANDRGLKMYSAVHRIIKTHRQYYPNFFLGYVKSVLRLTIARLKLFITKQK